MKDKNEVIAVILFLATTLGTAALVLGAQQVVMSSYDYELIARNGGHWSLHELKASVGKEVKIMIRNTDVVSHGFAIPDLRIDAGEIKAGEVTEVVFTPDEKGTFLFLCTIWCSDRHMRMKGELIVE